MTTKKKTPVKKALKKSTAAKAKKVSGKIKLQRIKKTGLKSRIRGHVSARVKRAQARRDSR
ncbi:hypothetical protein QPK87_15885 [Kamptonema cortianum]|nr:hypothetical protein [Kamptonema cortianum]MDL5048195.1 hypothetical protein [Oscillatoria amoena NRMC-F 0135]